MQVLTYGLENILPFVIKNASTKAKAKARTGLSAREKHIQEVCDEAERGGFSLFEDWYDVTLFLSYGTVYSLLFPLAPIVNYINNVIEQRTDLTKVIEISRRPNCRKVNNIGMWESCMTFQSYANVAQIALVGVISSYVRDGVTLEHTPPQSHRTRTRAISITWNSSTHHLSHTELEHTPRVTRARARATSITQTVLTARPPPTVA